MKKNIVLSSIATVALVSLVGCGGGSTPPAEEVSTSTLSGVAVDELILNGKVQVIKPDDNTSLVQGRTNSKDGTYTLNIENYAGPVVVNVTCDADSRLLIGQTEEACPSNLDLNSIANVEGSEVTVNVSPLSEVTYQRAVALGDGEVTADSIAQASSQISTIFGVNPILNDPTKEAYADIIEAFHTVADADEEKDLFDVIDDFASDMNDNTVDNSFALVAAMDEANVTNPLTLNETYVIPENPASEDAKKEVEAMIQALRTQGTTMQSYVDNEAEAMGTALDSVALDVQTVADYVVGFIDLVVQAREDGNATLTGLLEVNFNDEWVQMGTRVTQSDTNANEWTYSTGNAEYTGTIVFPEITEGMEYTFTSLNASVNGTLPYVDDIYSETPDIQTQNVSLNITLVKTGDVVDATFSDFTIENSGNKISIDSLTGSVSYSAPSTPDEDVVFNYVKFDAMTLTAVAGDYTATGTLSVPEYIVNTSLEARGGLEEVPTTYVSAGIYCSDYTTTISNVSATLNIGGENYTYHQYYGNDRSKYFELDNISGHYTEDEIVSASTITATCSDNSAPIVYVSVWDDTDVLIGNSGYIPKKVAFQGSLKNTVTNGELSGTVNIELINASELDLTTDINEANEPELNIDVSGKLVMPDRPDTSVNLSYKTNVADDAKKHGMTGSYNDGTTLITLEGSVDKDAQNGQLTFTNGTGITADFILTNDTFVNGNVANTTGSLVKKDGKVVATIEERNDDVIIIKYLDGSFESIF